MERSSSITLVCGPERPINSNMLTVSLYPQVNLHYILLFVLTIAFFSYINEWLDWSFTMYVCFLLFKVGHGCLWSEFWPKYWFWDFCGIWKKNFFWIERCMLHLWELMFWMFIFNFINPTTPKNMLKKWKIYLKNQIVGTEKWWLQWRNILKMTLLNLI